MTIKVGLRTITGVVKERAEARSIYDRARARGQAAALLEQERPNFLLNEALVVGETTRSRSLDLMRLPWEGTPKQGQ